jgi:hypothetical protein
MGTVTTQLIKMENLEFQPNINIATVYYNGGKANLFRVTSNLFSTGENCINR